MVDCTARVTFLRVQGIGPSTSLSFKIDTAPCEDSRGSFDFQVTVDQGARGEQRVEKTESWRSMGASNTEVNYPFSVKDDEEITKVVVVGEPDCICG